MSGSGRYAAILDANVLYSSLLRDLLLSLAAAGLYHARWSERINDEWTRNLAANRPDIASRIGPLLELVNASVADSSTRRQVRPPGPVGHDLERL